MAQRSLAQWLQWQAQLNPKTMELGLDRVGRVYKTLGRPRPARQVVSIAGTNGKGSSGAMLESICQAAGWQTGLYSSPHLLRYNERIRLNREPVSDLALCAVFERIDQARQGELLTYFEFGTLAALLLMADQPLDIAILEVGLGGRLDAVNLVDADIALVTSIGLDHCDWLGPDRDSIAREKMGIARTGRPLVCNDPEPPETLLTTANNVGVQLCRTGLDYQFSIEGQHWLWGGEAFGFTPPLPLPNLQGKHQVANAAGVLAVLALLGDGLPAPAVLAQGLQQIELSGRLERVSGPCEILLDVGHNPDAGAVIAVGLVDQPVKGRTLALFGALSDKDCAGILAPLNELVDDWHLLDTRSLEPARGADMSSAYSYLTAAGAGSAQQHVELAEVWRNLMAEVVAEDRIIVFGCFALVAEIMLLLGGHEQAPPGV